MVMAFEDDLDRINKLKQEIEYINIQISQILPRLIPLGGTATQVLAKINADDYNVEFQNAGAGAGRTFRQTYKDHLLLNR
jgi:hypothetical protein